MIDAADGSDRFYEMRAMEDGSWLVVVYSWQSMCALDVWQLKQLLPDGALDGVVPGQTTFDEIKKIDEYAAVYPILEGEDAFSEHRFSDGHSLVIYYKKAGRGWKVDRLETYSSDPSGFLDVLTPEDRQRLCPE
nr:hypothetical protein [bacterium]